MLKQLITAKKRKGKVVNNELKQYNKLMWEYLTAREELTHFVCKIGNQDLANFAEESILYCEVTLGIGTVEGNINQKIHNAELGIKRLVMTQKIIETYNQTVTAK